MRSFPIGLPSTVPSRRPDAAPLPRADVVGADELTPVLDGRWVRYVNLDNAATTPPLRAVLDAVTGFLPLYSSVHRGTGYKSRISTAAYEHARHQVGAFVGADPERDVVLFGKNTTEAVNVLARIVTIPPGSVVLTTMLEHHSNDLPWRARAQVVRVAATADGHVDEDHLARELARHAGRIALLAVTGASNVTGVMPPVHDLAERVHAAGGRILVDAAQLAAHRPLDMRAHDDPGHLDFVALSAHKMYAPFGTGALIGRRDDLQGGPHQPGGGTVRAVTADEVVWADLPDREEGGSPNVLGAVALGAATARLAQVGLGRIGTYECALADYATTRLAALPGITLLGPAPGGAAKPRGAVVAFTIAGRDSGLVAAVLGYEHGVGARSGCFCAQPYLAHLLGIEPAEMLRAAAQGRVPGAVRLSLAAYNDGTDIDRAVDAIGRVVAGDIAGDYVIGPDRSWRPRGYRDPLPWDSGGGVPASRRPKSPPAANAPVLQQTASLSRLSSPPHAGLSSNAVALLGAMRVLSERHTGAVARRSGVGVRAPRRRRGSADIGRRRSVGQYFRHGGTR